jgi:hypothetical protein
MKRDPADLVLYADAALLAVNKPAGLLALPDRYDRDLPHLKGVLEPAFGPLWITHGRGALRAQRLLCRP